MTPKPAPLVVNDLVELVDPPDRQPRLAVGLRGTVTDTAGYWGLVEVRWASGRRSLLAAGRLRRLDGPTRSTHARRRRRAGGADE